MIAINSDLNTLFKHVGGGNADNIRDLLKFRGSKATDFANEVRL